MQKAILNYVFYNIGTIWNDLLFINFRQPNYWWLQLQDQRVYWYPGRVGTSSEAKEFQLQGKLALRFKVWMVFCFCERLTNYKIHKTRLPYKSWHFKHVWLLMIVDLLLHSFYCGTDGSTDTSCFNFQIAKTDQQGRPVGVRPRLL